MAETGFDRAAAPTADPTAFAVPSSVFQRDVAGEAVGRHDLGRSREQVAALDVADEVDPLQAGELGVRLDDVGGSLLRLFADREQGYARILDSQDGAEKAAPMTPDWTRS